MYSKPRCFQSNLFCVNQASPFQTRSDLAFILLYFPLSVHEVKTVQQLNYLAEGIFLLTIILTDTVFNI